MFRPMAITVCSAILGSLILALTVVPAAAALLFRKPLPEHKDRLFNAFRGQYLVLISLGTAPSPLDHCVALLLVCAALALWPSWAPNSCRGWMKVPS